MKPMIYCEATAKGVHSFYLVQDGKEHFLFHQNYRRGVAAYFGRGVRLCEAFDFGRAGHDSAILRTMQKLPAYIKYAEKEYGIEVLEQTIKKNRRLRYAA
jgi:hypothetical protein